jgi:glucokinase
MSTTKKSLILGVDIGGTKISTGLVNPEGELLLNTRTPMVAKSTAEEGLQAVFNAIDKVLHHRLAKKVRAIGVSVPGWVDSKRGVLLGAANLPCWKNFPLVQNIGRHYKFPVKLGNDGNTAALAEAAWGAGAGYKNVFYVTLGTGIGTGLVLNRRIYDGRTGAASEGGHVTIDFRGPQCACGKRGCIEVYASGPAIARRARQRLSEPAAPSSTILQLANGKLDHVTTEIVSKAAKSGDLLAQEILQEAAGHLSIWLGNMLDLLEPDIIVIGGGIAHLMLQSLPRIRQQLDQWSINPRRQEIPIVQAHYGSESALLGAAALCQPTSRLWRSPKQR